MGAEHALPAERGQVRGIDAQAQAERSAPGLDRGKRLPEGVAGRIVREEHLAQGAAVGQGVGRKLDQPDRIQPQGAGGEAAPAQHFQLDRVGLSPGP